MYVLSNNDIVRKLNGDRDPVREQYVSVSLQPMWKGAPVPALPPQALWDLESLTIATAGLTYGINGQGANVYVIDSGVEKTHISLAKQKIEMQSFVPSMDAADGFGHGTWVAAKIGGQGVGVAPRCNLTCLRSLDGSGTGSADWTTAALEWICDQPDPHVVNMSLSSPIRTPRQEKFINRLHDMGVLVVAAAGNYGSDSLLYPAAFENALAVAAIDSKKNRASFSEYGNFVDICAPGVNCYSAFLGGTYRCMDGTSMATPIVSGVLALGWSLLLAKNPGINRKKARDILLKTINATADDLGAVGRDPYFGYGDVDALSFLGSLNQIK